MNILVCDDMKREAHRLKKLLTAEGHTPAVFNSGLAALQYIGDGGLADVCILDIIMPGMNGMELAGALRHSGWNGRIVFLSASREFGPESYRVGAFDYLLKPITPEGVREMLQRLVCAEKSADTKSVQLKIAGTMRSVLCRNISHVEVMQHTVVYRLTDGRKVEVYGTIGEAANQLLNDGRFARCHRSYIVNLDEVDSIIGYEITTRAGARIPISKNYAGIKKRYFERGLKGMGK